MRHRLVEELFRVLRRRHCCKVHSKRTPGNRPADLSAVQHRSNTTPTNDEKRSATKSLIRWDTSTTDRRSQTLPTLHTAGVAGSSPVSPTRENAERDRFSSGPSLFANDALRSVPSAVPHSGAITRRASFRTAQRRRLVACFSHTLQRSLLVGCFIREESLGL